MAAVPGPTRHNLLRPELIVIVGGLTATAHAAMMITIPALPTFVRELGDFWIIGASLSLGIALASASLGRFATNIPAGIMSERIGRKPIMIIGALIVALFGSLSGVAPNAPTFWLFRLLMGVGSAMVITVANVVATDLSSVDNRGRVLGMMHGMQLIVGISTPALGGFLAEYVNIRAPFYLSGGGTAVFALWALLRLPETRPHIPGISEVIGSVSRRPKGAASLLKDPSFFWICMLGFATFYLRNGATTGLIPLYMDDILGMGPGELGILFTVASVIHGVIIYPAGWASDIWGRKPLIVPAGIFVGVGVAAVPFMTEVTPFVITFIILHAAVGWGGQAPTAYLGDIAPDGMRGASFGMYRTFGDLAGIIGPLIAMGLADYVSYTVAFGSGALIWTVTIFMFWKVAKESAGKKRAHPRTMHADISPPPSR
jgi:DHA1 family multidrug resistance protein-like MFS transporter